MRCLHLQPLHGMLRQGHAKSPTHLASALQGHDTKHTNCCRFIPFSGGPRKCVGDQFALMEAVVALAVVLKRFDVEMVPDQDIGLTTGATIHTVNGLYVTVKERQQR